MWFVMKEKSQSKNGFKSINEQRMMVKGLEHATKLSNQALNTQWSLEGFKCQEMKCVDLLLELLSKCISQNNATWLCLYVMGFFDLMDKISQNGRNIYEWKQIKQTILEIDFDWTHRNGMTFSWWFSRIM